MNKEDEIKKINRCIGDLVYEKVTLKKAYNYYHGIRDAEQFRHLEDNYGIGTPTSVGFTPLIRKHIDVLVGEYLGLDPSLQVTCKDEETLSNIMRDKQLKIDAAVYQYIGKYLKNSIINILLKSDKPVNDPFVEKDLQKIADDTNRSFVSEYEMAAQNILEYIRNSRNIELKNKAKELFTDLLITGVCYYRTRPTNNKENIRLEVLNPLDTFIERNRNEYFLNKSPRCVIRRWLTEEQVLAEFGDELSNEAKATLKSLGSREERNYNTVFVRAPKEIEVTGGVREANSTGILGGLEATPIFPWDDSGNYVYNGQPVIAVNECEWIEYENKRMTKHEGIKIGDAIYITRGKVLPKDDKDKNDPTISVNGIFFSDKNGNPFSLELSTMNLQDKYDLLLYYRDNLIATSGTVGDWIDLAHLPIVLGEKTPERLKKWLAYKKQGMALFDSSQEGANILNTTFNGFDDTVKAQSIQAIELAIQSVEQQGSSITGVYQEKLGGVEQKDAVSNVKVGVKYSSLITKPYFSAMDMLYCEMNYDLLNLAKTVYTNGIQGTIILGDKMKRIFTALPQHYTVTDFDIHIKDSTDTFQTMQNIAQLNIEMIKAGIVEPEVAIDIATAKNLTELKYCMNLAIAKKKAENNMTTQLQQQLQQYDQQFKDLQKQMQELQNQNQQLQNKLQNNNDANIEIEKEKVRIEREKVENEKDYNDKIAKTKEQLAAVELYQMKDGNPYNNEIKNI